MSLFNFLQDKAAERGCKLLHAKDSNGCAKSGYVIWNRDGLWVRKVTLNDVWNYLQRQPYPRKQVGA